MIFAARYFVLISIVLKLVGGTWNTKDFLKREHSLVQPYYGSGVNIPNWHFTGSTLVTSQYVRLTPDLQSKKGSIWNSVPLQVQNWELQIQFKVHGKSNKDLYGDGFAIWYAKEPREDGPVFGSKDYFSGLAVILDTYSNHNGPHTHGHPYISAMINNGSLHYDHDRDGTLTQLAGCEAKFRNVDYGTHISIRYEADTLTVSTDVEKKNAWKECFSSKGVLLPTGYYIGISATTGDLSDNHDIISIRLFELDQSDDVKVDRSQIIPSAESFEAPRERVTDVKSSSNLKTFMLILFTVFGIAALGVLGYFYYQKRYQRKKKRFY